MFHATVGLPHKRTLGSRDNMSIVIVALKGAPGISEEAVKQEQELDARIEEKIKEILDNPDLHDSDLQYIMHILVESILNKLRPKKKDDEIEEKQILNKIQFFCNLLCVYSRLLCSFIPHNYLNFMHNNLLDVQCDASYKINPYLRFLRFFAFYWVDFNDHICVLDNASFLLFIGWALPIINNNIFIPNHCVYSSFYCFTSNMLTNNYIHFGRAYACHAFSFPLKMQFIVDYFDNYSNLLGYRICYNFFAKFSCINN
ncbi:hypothetical protein KUTeg_014463 [Tegillarca granosa]|uniref:Protein serine/threonine phosphatase 2C C-terminal domain-containing protein n=1 Tax=Tegillarca granosa TaxID=220873 RepID=A0ABQ9EWL8_TEGGR|nr:hypothetical protein KUTeg_014463 [Tegillarca granosa]